jgi:hypothetical protein
MPDTTSQDEPGAFFIRASTQKAEPLTCWQADILEGLALLLATDDWKVQFVSRILNEFRLGVREAPADILWDLRQAAEQFEINVKDARGIVDNYFELLDTKQPASEVQLVVGRGAKEPVKRPAGARK